MVYKNLNEKPENKLTEEFTKIMVIHVLSYKYV